MPERSDAIEARLLEWGLAGPVPNSREANLRAIRLLLDGVAFYTFGIERVAQAARRGLLDEAGVVAVMARANGHGSPEAFLGEKGEIRPRSARDGLVEAARLFARVVAQGGTIAFGTGHPGSMISFYNRLAAYARARGARIVQGEVGVPVGVDWVLDYVGDVAVTSDTCGVLHGHATRPMEQVIATWGAGIDLVVGDHGHAGAAINACIPTIAVMDTNDPALAVAKQLGAEPLVVVPLFDNRPNAITARLADLFVEMVEALPAPRLC
ncbi:MAG TPA: phosphatase [Pantanalinema sp.]